jgi:hypothetical protein
MKKPQPKAEVPEYLLKDAGVGISHQLSDNAFWLDLPDDIITLLDKLDRDGDPSVLLPYLKVPPAARPYFADLFERMRLRRVRRGRPKFRKSESAINMRLAVRMYRQYVKEGMSRDEAEARAAEENGVKLETLHNTIIGKNRTLREAKL